MNDLLPLFLRMKDRRVLVVGAGSIGTKKAADFAGAGARVTVVAREASAEMTAMAAAGRVVLVLRDFDDRDVDGVHLVVSATGDAGVQARIFAAADARGTFVLAVDDPAHGSAASGAVVRRPPFLVAISSSGEAPALSRLIREIVEAALPEDRWVDAARELRTKWKREKTPMNERFAELLRAITAR